MWGPFCSVPPVGMITVVVPEASASRTSGQVRSSRNTVSGVWAEATPDRHPTAKITSANRMVISQ